MKIILLKLSFVFVLGIHFEFVSSLDEFGPQPKNPSRTPEALPTDVASVSQFIKDFQRQIDDASLVVSRSDLTLLKDYSHDFSSAHADGAGSPQVSAQSEIPSPPTANTSSSTTEKNVTSLVKCITDPALATSSVEIVNTTRLMELLTGDDNVTSRLMPAPCLVLLFYMPTCPFSCLAAPHFNALARAFPYVKPVAINAHQHQSFNTQLGIGGVPTIMLFHNGRPAAKFNESEYTLEMFARFITKFTGLKPVDRMFVTSGDFGGPVPSVLTKETDYWLGVAWLVVVVAVCLLVSRSAGWKSLVEIVQSAWREAQAHHDHTD